MVIFSFLCLILTIGGVSALLMRNVFIPVQRLRKYVESSTMGNTHLAPPPNLPHDLDIIARGYFNASKAADSKKQNPEGTINCLKI
jgi:hypothetical protein